MIDETPEPIGSPAYESFSVQAVETGMLQIFQVRRDPEKGELVSQEFCEDQTHGGSVRDFKTVEWKEKIPRGLRLRGASAGADNDLVNTYWVSWIDSAKASALAITQENPITAPMLPGDESIHAPIQARDGKLRLFFWRKSGSGFSLCQHVFSGDLKQKGSVHTDTLADVAYRPLFTRAEPIAVQWIRDKGFVDAGLAVLGWLSEEGGGVCVHAAWLDGKTVKVFDSDPIAGHKPYANQRLGIWCDPAGILRMAWLMGRVDSDTLRVAEWTLNKNGTRSLRIHETGFPDGNIRSAALVIPRRSEEKRSPELNAVSCFLLTKSGGLMAVVAGEFSNLRSGLPPSYDFPIFSSAVGMWEARCGPQGKVYFASPSSPAMGGAP